MKSREGSSDSELTSAKGTAAVLHCRNGEHTTVELVKHWPAQDCKSIGLLPSRMLVDGHRRAVAFGYETEDEVYEKDYKEGKLTEVKGYKLKGRAYAEEADGNAPLRYDEYCGRGVRLPRDDIPLGVSLREVCWL